MTQLSFHKNLSLFLIFFNIILFVLILKFSSMNEVVITNFYSNLPENEVLEYREFLITLKNNYALKSDVSELCDMILVDINNVIFTKNYTNDEINKIRKKMSYLSLKLKEEFLIKQEVYSL